MLALKKQLAERLKGSRRLAFLGIGTECRADDYAGILAAERIKERLKARKPRFPVKVFLGYSVPESITGEIRKFKPDDIVIIDAADTRQPAGKVTFIPEYKESGVSFSTHRLPVKILIDYLRLSLGSRVILLGIQPKCLTFGRPVSQVVKNAVKKICDAIEEVVA